MVLSTKQWSARQTRTAPGAPPNAGGGRQRRPVDASINEKEMSEHPGWGWGGGTGKDVENIEKK